MLFLFVSSRRRHTRCALVTGVQTCALPIWLVGQVRAIGRSLNQAVRAVNAANRPDSSLEIQQAATAVIAMESRVSETINHVAGALTEILSGEVRSEEHTSELKSLMRISYAVLCLKTKIHYITTNLLQLTTRYIQELR